MCEKEGEKCVRKRERKGEKLMTVTQFAIGKFRQGINSI